MGKSARAGGGAGSVREGGRGAACLEAVLERAAGHELAHDDQGLVAHGAGAKEEDQVGVALVAGGGGGGAGGGGGGRARARS